MTVLPFPYPTDKWCEQTLTPAEGKWQQSGYGDTSITTDAFVVGQKSIKVSTTGTASILRAIFKLNTPLSGLIYPGGTIQFYIACSGNMLGTGYVELHDSAMRFVRKNIAVNNAGVWELKTIAFTDFAGDPAFDWSAITWIYVQMDKNALAASFWLDDLYFTFNVPDSILLVQSLPTGKSGVINTSFLPELFGMPANFITPSTITLPEGLPVTIQMDATNFDHWADDVSNINPTRSFTMPVNNLILQAVYSIQANPLLVIDSFDQDMNTVSGTSAVKIVFISIPQYVNVPFAARILKGIYSFTAVDVAQRKFDYWIMPDKSKSTERTVSYNVQGDTRLETHWQVSGVPPSSILPLAVVVIVSIIAFVGYGLTRKA